MYAKFQNISFIQRRDIQKQSRSKIAAPLYYQICAIKLMGPTVLRQNLPAENCCARIWSPKSYVPKTYQHNISEKKIVLPPNKCSKSYGSNYLAPKLTG